MAPRSSRCAYAGDRRSGRAPRLLGWLAAASLLLHGWLPIVLQVSLLASETGGHGRAHHAPADGAAAPAGKSQECPLLHSAVCLCATFAKVMPAPSAPAVAGPPEFAARRRRRPRPRLPRHGRQLLFDARAPPVSA